MLAFLLQENYLLPNSRADVCNVRLISDGTLDWNNQEFKTSGGKSSRQNVFSTNGVTSSTFSSEWLFYVQLSTSFLTPSSCQFLLANNSRFL